MVAIKDRRGLPSSHVAHLRGRPAMTEAFCEPQERRGAGWRRRRREARALHRRCARASRTEIGLPAWRPRRHGLRCYGRQRLLREGLRRTVSVGDGAAQRVFQVSALRDVPNLGEGLRRSASVGGGAAQVVSQVGALRNALCFPASVNEGIRRTASVGGGAAQVVSFGGVHCVMSFFLRRESMRASIVIALYLPLRSSIRLHTIAPRLCHVIYLRYLRRML